MTDATQTLHAPGPTGEGAAAPPPRSEAEPASGPPSHLARTLSPKNIGAVYVWIGIVLLFVLLEPDAFASSQTAKSVLNQYAITGMVALALVVPLATGVYDLSIGFVMALAGVLAAYLLRETSLSPVIVGVLTIGACVLVGLLNALVVVGLRVNSFIGTLGTGAILAAITSAFSKDQTIVGRVGDDFAKLSTTNVSGVTMPVIYMVLLMIAIGYWLERTQSGRQLYATGFDRETARLAGTPVDRLATLAFVTSAAVAGFAGMCLAARVSSATPDAGTAYLIPAFSAAFLGATQLRGGRFNPWGTVIGVLLLGTGNVGLLIAGGPTWTPRLFEGVVLIAAVALSVSSTEGGVRRLLGGLRRKPDEGPVAAGKNG